MPPHTLTMLSDTEFALAIVVAVSCILILASHQRLPVLLQPFSQSTL